MISRTDLERKALETIERHGMLTLGDRVVVSVSGGPDSLALLLLLVDLSREYELELAVFHLDHMIRGEESAEDAGYVRDLARDLGVRFRVESVDVPSLLKTGRRSTEETAREVRRGRLMDYADEISADRVAVGHNADDQVETFLMRVIQGAGATGLSGIRPVAGRIIRPLISVWREEVEEYCRLKGAVPRIDSSNVDRAYLRNRVRNTLLPFMTAEFGPGVREAVLRGAESISVDREFIDREVERAFEAVARAGEEEVGIDIGSLADLHLAVRRGVVREAWRRLLPQGKNLSWRHVADVLEKVAGGDSGARLLLPCDMVAERVYERLILRPADRPKGPPGTVELPVPGEAMLPWSGEAITAEVVAGDEVEFTGDRFTEYVRPDLSRPLTVRTPRRGDRFLPLGMGGSKKLSDFFTDSKVPRRLRERCPLVCSGGDIVWVVGHMIDERSSLKPEHREAIRLRLTGRADHHRPADEERGGGVGQTPD